MPDLVNVSVRWMIRRDMDEVMAIEREAFDLPMSEKEMLGHLNSRHCVGRVAIDDLEHVVGYMIYYMRDGHFHLFSIAVRRDVRRQMVGRALLASLVSKLDGKRKRIRAFVREKNLAAQLFLRRIGFRAQRCIPDYFYNGEMAYEFVFKIKKGFADG